MNILVLGSTGYLGTRVVKKLLREGHRAICLKRGTSSVEDLRQQGVLESEIWDISDLKRHLDEGIQIECMIQCAVCYEKKDVVLQEIFEANYAVPLKVIMECINFGIEKILTIDTALPNDFNMYTKTKSQLAEMLKWYAQYIKSYNRKVYIRNILLENYYGEQEPNERFIPMVIRKLRENQPIDLTEGNQRRDFIYIEDVVNAIVFLAIDKELWDEYTNIPLGTGEGPHIKEVVEYMKDIIGSSSRLNFGAINKRKDEPDSIADISYLQKRGWKPQYGWEDGLKKIIE